MNTGAVEVGCVWNSGGNDCNLGPGNYPVASCGALSNNYEDAVQINLEHESIGIINCGDFSDTSEEFCQGGHNVAHRYITHTYFKGWKIA